MSYKAMFYLFGHLQSLETSNQYLKGDRQSWVLQHFEYLPGHVEKLYTHLKTNAQNWTLIIICASCRRKKMPFRCKSLLNPCMIQVENLLINQCLYFVFSLCAPEIYAFYKSVKFSNRNAINYCHWGEKLIIAVWRHLLQCHI